MTNWLRTTMLALSTAAVALLPAPALGAGEDEYRAAVFALIDANEWCPGGSVYLDLATGSFQLYPRLNRRACQDKDTHPLVEQGTLPADELAVLRSDYREAVNAGLKREQCELVVGNGGPEALVLTGPGFSAETPENLGCWSGEARALHNDLFRVFGAQR
jgi:hypothetical protein